jgi:hypothetical protein
MHLRTARTLRRLSALAALLTVAGCEPARLPARGSINGPQALAFRCVYPAPDDDAGVSSGQLFGVPVEGCGCTVREANGTVRQLGRVECRCTVQTTVGAEQHGCRDGVDNDADGKTDDADEDCKVVEGTSAVRGELGLCAPAAGGTAVDEDGDGLTDADDPGCMPGMTDVFEERGVDRLRATCTTNADGDQDCIPVRHPETGDFIPVFDDAAPEDEVMDCEPAAQGAVRAYVGASGRGEVAVVDLAEDTEIVDIDRSIPGTTSIYVDDLVSDIGADPEGRFVFTVNSSTGSLSVIRHDDVSVAYTVELADEPLFETTVFPSPTAPREQIEAESRRLAWLNAPLSGRIYEIDLDVLAAGPRDGKRHGPQPGLIRRVIELDADAGTTVRPGKMAVDDDAARLYVTHRDARSLSVVNLADDAQQVIPLTETRCDDGYLVDVEDLGSICRNGRDDDADGLTDAADPECQRGDAWEGGLADRCFQIPQCENGLDDDGDGDLDAEDADCQSGGGRWEGATSACANRRDDDGDGFVDRDDIDCANEADDDESGREVSTCADGLDNDGNGLTDLDDATCQGERCDDGEDNREPSATEDSASDTDDDDCQADDAALGDGLPEEGGGRAAAAALGDTGAAAGDTPCTNAADDDGDGLTDADDPGCRFFSAARRFGFEVEPACGDGQDNDRDGRVDFPQDPDCYAASDTNEGGAAVVTGTSDVVGLRQDLGDGRTVRSAYVLDRATGEVVALDFGDEAEPRPVPVQRVLETNGAVQSMTLRQTAEAAALIVVNQNGDLGTVELYGPQLVVDHAGRPVFARIQVDASTSPDTWSVEHFYVVEAGKAWLVTGLEAYLEETGGDLLTPAQIDSLASGTVPQMMRLPVPAVVDSQVAVDGKSPAPITVWGGEDDPSPRGTLDPLVSVLDARARLEAPTNVRMSAASRTNRLAGSPTLYIQDTSQVFDPRKHPAFCRPATDDDKTDGVAPVCIPQGRNARGEAEDPAAAEQRTAQLVQGNEAIRIVEDASEVLPADTFSLAYEGVLPGSESKSGVFGAREVPEGASLPDATWSLLDYDRDFCRIGVEPGDVVVVDNFVGVAKELKDECAALASRAAAYGDPRRYREPIRYTVQSLTAHRLVLGHLPPADANGDRPAARTSYADQVPLDPRVGLPLIPDAAPAPAAKCAAQFIRYKVRARDAQWLLTGARSGLRHPWVSRDGRCEQAEDRVAARRAGRVELNTPFENEWFKFTLGFLPQTSTEVQGVPEGLQPYQLDTRYEFTTIPGRQYNTLSGEIALPRALYWLPVDDRLYIVDSALSTIAEFTGFDPFRSRLRLVRRYN